MVEQLAPQGWSPVDNIPSLNPVSVFSAAPQLMSLNLLLSVFYDRGTSYTPTFSLPTCDQPIRYHQIPTEKRFKERGMTRKRKKSTMTLNTGSLLVPAFAFSTR